METLLTTLVENKWIQALLIIIGSFVVALIVGMVIKQGIMRLAKKTGSQLDDRILEITRGPIYLCIIFVGFAWAVRRVGLPEAYAFIVLGLMKSAAIVIWAIALGRIADVIFKWMEGLTRFKIIQPRTVPIFDIVTIILIWGGASYLVLLTWHIDVTGWLASAGVVGIAVGFAAKDTLANLFSGIFILADAPYKIGDYIILGTGERGMVTDIGIRSTRLLTRDDIEIIVPNAVIANTKITNEAGGPHEKERVRCTVSVAYGSDINQVKDVLMAAALENEMLCKEPEPRVRFRSFGDSGLVFQVLAWIDKPVLRGRALDGLNTSVYLKLNAAGIEIPYTKQDIYIKEVPPDNPGVHHKSASF